MEDDILPAESVNDHLVHVPDVGESQGALHGKEVIAEHRLRELWDAERIEAPVDGMPALEGVVRRN